ncbi:MAG: glycosyltransferase family 2 protein [Janthinobacterium lividum]
MATIACILMMKNEQTLAEPWLLYHADLFGLENLYVFDNGSTDIHSLSLLKKYEEKGLNVDRFFKTPIAFTNKGEILGQLIKALEGLNKYDYFVPLDCDEFIMLRDSALEDGYTCSKDRIIGYFDSIGADEGRVLLVNENLMNILGRTGEFRRALYSKTIYPKGAFVEMDHGYHGGISSRAPGYREIDIVYAHFHFRPYEELVQFAREKLRMTLTDAQIDDKLWLSSFKGPGFHMVGYLTGNAESYYSQFRAIRDTVHLPELMERFTFLGVAPPFSYFKLPAETARNLVIDRIEHDQIQGWARDRTNPMQPLFTQLLLDGVPFVEVICDEPRADVAAEGYETDKVGFGIRLPEAAFDGTRHILSASDLEGNMIPLSMNNIEFKSIEVGTSASLPLQSHIDGLIDGGIQGWVLEIAEGEDGRELKGRCSVILVHDSMLIAEVVADLERSDVSTSFGSDAKCGFRFELPAGGIAGDLGVYAMPGMRQLHGSPFSLTQVATAPTPSLPSELLLAAAGTPTLVAA